MADNKDKEIYADIENKLQKIRDNSILVGSRLTCGTILSKAKDETKSKNERLKEIIGFCKRSLNVSENNLKTKDGNKSICAPNNSELFEMWGKYDKYPKWKVCDKALEVKLGDKNG